MYNNASELYKEHLEICFNQYETLSDAKIRKLGDKYDPEELFLGGYDYSVWPENKEESIDKEESTDKEELIDKEELTDVSKMLPPEGDEEVREGRELKILTTNKLSTRLPILLTQMKAGNNANNLKNKIRQILNLLISIIESLKKFATI